MKLDLIDNHSVGLSSVGARLREIALEVQSEFIDEEDDIAPIPLPERKLRGLATVALGEIVEAQFSDGSTFRGVLIVNPATETGRLINFEIERSRHFAVKDVQAYSILQQDRCAEF